VLAETDTNFWLAAGISSSVVNAGLSDTRVIYDPLSGHWFAVEITTPNMGNQVLIGRSDGTDPSGTWRAVNFTGDSGFADYPTLGVDANAVYVGTNNFTNGGRTGTDKSVTMNVFPKADLLLSPPSVAHETTHVVNDPQSTNGNGSMGYTLQG
jgi:hypothetical protein